MASRTLPIRNGRKTLAGFSTRLVYQFKVTLQGISPPIWRRIQVPESYTFWDLHVAIQDSMGWLDYHLHAFDVKNIRSKRAVEIGIPDGESGVVHTVPGWEVGIADHFIRPGMSLPYHYDFGDGWLHDVLLEGILVSESTRKYPRCIAGERACPPEDCGGVEGYLGLVKALQDPMHRDYAGLVEWLKGHAKDYYPYDPEDFDPKAVRFSNPRKRWEKAFSRRHA